MSSNKASDIPTAYQNLTEIQAPAPAPQTRASLPSDQLETRLSSDQEFINKRFEKRKAEDPDGPRSSQDVPAQADATVDREHTSTFARELYTVSYLIFFSLLGTLARLGLQALTFYPGAPVQTGVLWANFAGSLVMGFWSEDRNLFRQEKSTPLMSKQEEDRPSDPENELRDQSPVRWESNNGRAHMERVVEKKSIPLYIGLATGFCGCFTSFSSFIRDAFLALSNALPVPVSHTASGPIDPLSTVSRNSGYSFLAILAIVILTITLSLGAIYFGAHLALALQRFTLCIPSLLALKLVDRLMIFLAWGSWFGAIIMTVFPPDRERMVKEQWRGDALFALVSAPLGCLLRFYASAQLNGRIPSFPLGTFLVNMAGTMLESIFFDLQHAPIGKRVGCQALQGMMDGFCGCLTTVSTWVLELKGLKPGHAYIYGTASVGVGVSLGVVIMGSLQWTDGFHQLQCGQ